MHCNQIFVVHCSIQISYKTALPHLALHLTSNICLHFTTIFVYNVQISIWPLMLVQLIHPFGHQLHVSSEILVF